MEIEHVYNSIIHAAVNIHNAVGPGLNKSVYEECLGIELQLLNLHHEFQKPVQIVYKNKKIKSIFYADVVVDNQVLVQIFASEKLLNQHAEQTLTLLKLLNLKDGVMINFNESNLINGIKRIPNKQTSNFYLNEP